MIPHIRKRYKLDEGENTTDRKKKCHHHLARMISIYRCQAAEVNTEVLGGFLRDTIGLQGLCNRLHHSLSEYTV